MNRRLATQLQMASQRGSRFLSNGTPPTHSGPPLHASPSSHLLRNASVQVPDVGASRAVHTSTPSSTKKTPAPPTETISAPLIPSPSHALSKPQFNFGSVKPRASKKPAGGDASLVKKRAAQAKADAKARDTMPFRRPKPITSYEISELETLDREVATHTKLQSPKVQTAYQALRMLILTHADSKGKSLSDGEKRHMVWAKKCMGQKLVKRTLLRLSGLQTFNGLYKEHTGADVPLYTTLVESPTGTKLLPAKVRHKVTTPEEPAQSTPKRPKVTPFREGEIPPLPQEAAPSFPLKKLDRDPENRVPTPMLAHGLDRVLFNPSVHWLQDPHSRVYNFDPFLQTIPPVESFAFDKLGGYIPSSQDTEMLDMAKKHDRKFTGSTSSLTHFMAHIYFMISRYRQLDMSVLSSAFSSRSKEFTLGISCPGDITLHHHDGVYAVNSGNGTSTIGDDKNIFMWQGTMLEKFLTLRPPSFNTLMRTTSDDSTPLAPDIPDREAYQFSQTNKFIMRSQLDCVDPRLPGTGVFDIKTRAAVAIRHDKLNYPHASGYLLRKQFGEFESFEREYYDLIRSAMLKYNFQARIGHMDGIFVAYHNTARIFGFQYLPLHEMDDRLFGSSLGGDRAFAMCVELSERVLEAIAEVWPGQDVTCAFASSKKDLRIFVQPVEHSSEERPIAQFVLRVENVIDGAVVEGPFDFHGEDTKWSLSYTLEKRCSEAHRAASLKKLETIRTAQDKIKRWILPEGVGPEDIKDYWRNLDFSGQGVEAEIDDEQWSKLNFSDAPSFILQMRELAKAGREHLERTQANETGTVVRWSPTDDAKGGQ